MQELFNICKSSNVIHPINKFKEIHFLILSIDVGKAFNKIQDPFLIETLKKMGIEELTSIL